MARGLKNIAVKAKKTPKKKATSLAKLKLGDEPSFIVEPTTSELVRALNWYKQCADDPEAHKAWVHEFLTSRGWESDDIKVVTAKIKKLIRTHIFIARMINRGVPIHDGHDWEAYSYFQRVFDRQNEDEYDEEGNPIIKAAPVRVNNKLGPMVHFIEEQFEIVKAGGEAESVYTKLVEMGCNASIASQLRSALKFQMDEYAELGKPAICDEDLEEAYPHLSKPTRRKLGAFVQKLQEDLSSFAQVAKATRKPRKKKPVKLEKLVARVKYKVKDDQYQVASVPPERIFKAKWLWVFNTKYRTIAFYEAENDEGLSIKGTTVTGFKNCGMKKLRKPDQQLPNFGSGAVKTLPKHFDAIKTTASEPNGRLNEDTIILRVFT